MISCFLLPHDGLCTQTRETAHKRIHCCKIIIFPLKRTHDQLDFLSTDALNSTETQMTTCDFEGIRGMKYFEQAFYSVLQSYIARRYLNEKLKGAFPRYIGHWGVLPRDGLALHMPSAKEKHLLGTTRSRDNGAPVIWPLMTILMTTYQPRFAQYPWTPPCFQDRVALQTSHFHVSEAFVNSTWWVNESLTLNEVTPF